MSQTTAKQMNFDFWPSREATRKIKSHQFHQDAHRPRFQIDSSHVPFFKDTVCRRTS